MHMYNFAHQATQIVLSPFFIVIFQLAATCKVGTWTVVRIIFAMISPFHTF